MGVTLGTYGATGASGFTTFTASVDTNIYYVSTSGNDGTAVANDIAHPWATPRTAFNQMRGGYPDWVLLKKGDTWTNQAFGVADPSKHYGRSANEPQRIGSYGTGARPRIKYSQFNTDGVSVNVALRLGAGGFPLGPTGNYFAVTGIHFWAYLKDEYSPDLVLPQHDEYNTGAIYHSDAFQWFLIEDCVCQAASLTIDSGYSKYENPAAVRNGTAIVRRSLIFGNYGQMNHKDHDGNVLTPPATYPSLEYFNSSAGIYCSNIDNFVLEECLLDHNGWADALGPNDGVTIGDAGAQRNGNSHNLYGQYGNGIVTARGNIVTRGSYDGLKTRGGGNMTDNYFDNNQEDMETLHPDYGFFNQWPTADMFISDNVCRHLASTYPRVLVADPSAAAVAAPIGKLNILRNIFAHAPTMAVAFGGYINNVTVQNNVFFSVNDAINGGAGGVNFITTPNQTDLNGDNTEYSFSAPTRDAASYNGTLGGTATLAAFITEVKLQSADNWRPAYTANAVNNYVRAGFGMAPVIIAEASAGTSRPRLRLR